MNAKVHSLNLIKVEAGSDELEELQVWLLHCRQIHLPIDINRLLRFALCRNALTFARFLIQNGADPTRLDIMDRSVIFYGLWPFPDKYALSYVTSTLRDNTIRMNVDQRDTEGKTPLQYAVLLKSPAAVETLLLMNAAIHTDLQQKLQQNRSTFSTESCIEVLLCCKIFFAELPLHPSGLKYIRTPFHMRGQDVQPEQDHNKTAWLHFHPFLVCL
jgi:ankyrin repeat protein